MKKKVFGILLSMVFFCSYISTIGTYKVSAKSANDTDVFLKQSTDYTCTLTAAAVMLRRRAIIDNGNWQSITEQSLRSTAWVENVGLRFQFSYSGMSVGHGYFSNVVGNLISMLQQHPEGVVAYNSSQPHAVLITDYDSSTGNFYCGDPMLTSGRIPVASSTLRGNDILSKLAGCDAYWYITNKSGGSVGADPQGILDECIGGAGTVRVRGWAFDKDDTSKALSIHVYIGGEAGQAGTEGHGDLVANQSRPDVNNVYGCGSNHGFDSTITTSKRGSQVIAVYAINVGGGANQLIGKKTVNISEIPTAATPSITASNVSGGKNVKITTSTSGATIYYTTDGSNPTTSSKKYTSAFNITSSTTIKAIAVRSGYKNSSTASSTISVGQAATPVIAPVNIVGGKNVAIICATGGATIYYTTDGSNPTTSSKKYTSAFNITSSTTIKAIAVGSGYKNSDTASSTISVGQAATPVIAPVNIIGGKNVAITCATGSATIYYTTDGSNPTTSSKKYTSAFNITSSTTVKAIAVGSGYTNSGTASSTINIPKAAVPQIKSDGLRVTITSESDMTVYYTTDGSNPGTSSIKYTEPFVLNKNAKIKAFAIANGYAASAVSEYNYIFYGSVDIDTSISATKSYYNVFSEITDPIPAVYVVAFYDSEGTFMDFDTKNITGADTTVEMRIPRIEGAAFAKIFLWNDIDNMYPLAQSAEIKLN